jgi:hypothetical protein
MFKAACILLAVSAVTPLAFADQTSKSAKIEELLNLTNSQKMMDQQYANVETLMRTQIRQMNLTPEGEAEALRSAEKMTETLRSTLSWERLRPEFVKIYGETFSEAELDGIVQFYRSPAGQALLAKMPLLMSNTMQTVGKIVGEMMQDFRKKTQEIEKKYPAPKKTG